MNRKQLENDYFLIKKEWFYDLMAPMFLFLTIYSLVYLSGIGVSLMIGLEVNNPFMQGLSNVLCFFCLVSWIIFALKGEF